MFEKLKGKATPHIYCQKSEPETKEGIWIEVPEGTVFTIHKGNGTQWENYGGDIGE